MHTVQTSPNQCKNSTIPSAPSWTLRTTAQSPVSSPGPPRPQTAGGRRAKRPHRTAARGTTGLNRPSRAAPRRRADLLSCPVLSCSAQLPSSGPAPRRRPPALTCPPAAPTARPPPPPRRETSPVSWATWRARPRRALTRGRRARAEAGAALLSNGPGGTAPSKSARRVSLRGFVRPVNGRASVTWAGEARPQLRSFVRVSTASVVGRGEVFQRQRAAFPVTVGGPETSVGREGQFLRDSRISAERWPHTRRRRCC